MSELEARCLSQFEAFLRTLPKDARTLATAIRQEGVEPGVRLWLIGGLNYLLKSLDLIDDGIEGLGYLDDAFVLRLAVASARVDGELPAELVELADGAELIAEFLGELAPRMQLFIESMKSQAVRGRTPEQIAESPELTEEFLGEIHGWASRYEPPAVAAQGKLLTRMHSFLAAKLPAA